MVNEVAMGPISRIGFVGLGNMGWPMARRLARRYRLAVMDVRTDVAESFASQHGTQVVTDRIALAEASDAVITMLPTGGDVREVALGSSGNPGLVAGIGAWEACSSTWAAQHPWRRVSSQRLCATMAWRWWTHPFLVVSLARVRVRLRLWSAGNRSRSPTAVRFWTSWVATYTKWEGPEMAMQ